MVAAALSRNGHHTQLSSWKQAQLSHHLTSQIRFFLSFAELQCTLGSSSRTQRFQTLQSLCYLPTRHSLWVNALVADTLLPQSFNVAKGFHLRRSVSKLYKALALSTCHPLWVNAVAVDELLPPSASWLIRFGRKLTALHESTNCQSRWLLSSTPRFSNTLQPQSLQHIYSLRFDTNTSPDTVNLL